MVQNISLMHIIKAGYPLLPLYYGDILRQYIITTQQAETRNQEFQTWTWNITTTIFLQKSPGASLKTYSCLM